ncbi:MAG: DUF4249 domain-containing protein [Bacteroidales bacterium]|nr:DUF4249 domain-containing protein [Bacteroidales bacterium]
MKRLLLIFCLAALSSCTSDYIKVAEQQIVVEGWIDSGLPPIVMVTKSAPLSTEFRKIEDLGENIVRWAKVTVSDGTDEVVLIGRPDDHYDTGYIYTTAWMDGVPGRTYSLKVEYDGKVLTAKTTIPEPRTLDKIETVPSGDAFSILATFSPSGEYYAFFTRVEKVDSCYAPSFLGVFSNDDFQGREQLTTGVNPGRTIARQTYTSSYNEGDKVHIKFCTMDRQTWEYWNAFQRVSSLSASPVFPVRENLPSNIEGGLGYWAGYGASWSTVEVHR